MERGSGSRADSAAAFIETVRGAFVDEGGTRRMMGDPDALVAAVTPHVTEDLTVVMDGGAFTNEYRGLAGLRRGWSDLLSAFDEIEVVPEELRESPDGDAVVEFVHLVGKPHGAPLAIDQDAAAVWRLRDGRVCAVEFHMSRERALRSGGLDPANPGPPAA
jgi:ketosteroid isomerase-like protein